MKTCRTYHHGQAYWSKRRNRVIHVPKGSIHNVCEACEYEVALSVRVYGLHGAEEIRKRHVKTAHFTELVKGTMTIALPESLTLGARS